MSEICLVVYIVAIIGAAVILGPEWDGKNYKKIKSKFKIWRNKLD